MSSRLEKSDADESAVRAIAAGWIVRRDRGLSTSEAIEFELWLAADPRHAAAFQRASGAWSRLDHLPDSVAAPVLIAAKQRRSFWYRPVLVGSLAAAALVFVAIRLSPAAREAAQSSVTTSATPTLGGPRQLTLSDGTVVQLNTGGDVEEHFTAAERRVVLARGEAHFAVTKNPVRPFVVDVGAFEVRAVGTAFNVNLQSAVIDVLVTEGTVQISCTPASAPSSHITLSNPPLPLLGSGQRAVVSRSPTDRASVVVTTYTPEEMARTLAWQAPLLRLGGATLAELVLEFQRRSGRRVILADPALAELRIGGRFRADDADGFALLMATTLDLEVERTPDGTLVLRKKKSEIR